MTEPNKPSGAAASDTDPALPHDRDERSRPRAKEDGGHNREPIEQARQDVEDGIKDTERIGTPNDVPSSSRDRGKR